MAYLRAGALPGWWPEWPASLQRGVRDELLCWPRRSMEETAYCARDSEGRVLGHGTRTVSVSRCLGRVNPTSVHVLRDRCAE